MENGAVNRIDGPQPIVMRMRRGEIGESAEVDSCGGVSGVTEADESGFEGVSFDGIDDVMLQPSGGGERSRFGAAGVARRGGGMTV